MQIAEITSFLMFQKVVARHFSPYCRARCLFLLSEEIKADHSVQALHGLKVHDAMKASSIMRKDWMLRSRGGKGTASQGLEEGVLLFLCRPQKTQSTVADETGELVWKSDLLFLAEATRGETHLLPGAVVYSMLKLWRLFQRGLLGGENII